MYCHNCGAECVDGVCPNNCEIAEPQVEIKPQAVCSEEAKRAEVFSIIALVAGILSIAGQGIVYGVVSMVFATLYKNRVGEYNDMAKIGKNLGLAGIIINAAMVVCILTLYVCIYAGVIVLGGLSASGTI